MGALPTEGGTGGATAPGLDSARGRGLSRGMTQTTYPVAITPEMAALIEGDAAHDPIARQFVPQDAEHESAPGESADPIGDRRLSPLKGIVHRYADRVLLKPTLTCPVYCRFCFRREDVGKKSGTLTAAEFEAALDYIRGNPAIWEVIVTGGDPFVLSPRRIGALVAALDAIPHLGSIRFHTRVPVVAPGRVSAALVRALAAEKAVHVVIHANHPRELTEEARAAILRFVRAGIPVLAQSVLLKGVNDDAATLEALYRRLVAMRVRPYYLHHLDLAPGTGHFRTGLAEGQALMRALRGRVSGLCQPTYVLDVPGGFGKVPAGPCYVRMDGTGFAVTDPDGCTHAYPPGLQPARAVRRSKLPGTARKV
jgi:lysine 2,3-aminomutase